MAARMYWLTVDGELGDQMASAFPGMTLSRRDGVTTLSGVCDQAALQGLFQRVSDLGLTLLETKSKSANRSRSDAARAGAAGRKRSTPQERSER